MKSLQLIEISYQEFQDLLQQTAELAAKKALEEYIKVKADPNEDITVAAIAELWGCSRMNVFRKIKAHKVPRFRLGRETAIKRKYLEQIKKPLRKDY